MASGVDAEKVRRDYSFRSGDPEEVNGELDGIGFVRVAPGRAEEGDILLVQAGAMQLHIVILTPGGYLHADARLRRVVEVPGRVPWPVLSAWRHPELVTLDEASVPPSQLN